MVEDKELAEAFENDEELAFLTDFQRKVKATPGSITIDAEEWVEREIKVQKALILARKLAETMQKLSEVRKSALPTLFSYCSGTAATVSFPGYARTEKSEDSNA